MERAHDLEVYLFELLSLDVDSRLSSSQRNLQSFKDRWYPCCIWLLGCYVHGFAKSANHLVCWGVLSRRYTCSTYTPAVSLDAP